MIIIKTPPIKTIFQLNTPTFPYSIIKKRITTYLSKFNLIEFKINSKLIVITFLLTIPKYFILRVI